jgi:hypothetical protein
MTLILTFYLNLAVFAPFLVDKIIDCKNVAPFLENIVGMFEIALEAEHKHLVFSFSNLKWMNFFLFYTYRRSIVK